MENTQQIKENPLGFSPIGKLLPKFAVPAIISMLVNALYNIVSQIFIGQDNSMSGKNAPNRTNPMTTITTAPSLLLAL